MGSPQKPDAGILDNWEFRSTEGWPSHPYDIPARLDQIPRQPHCLLNAAPCPIALHRLPQASTDRESAAAERETVGQQTQYQQRVRVTHTCLPNQPESLLIGQTIPALHLNTITDYG